jgi:hypothetical protein
VVSSDASDTPQNAAFVNQSSLAGVSALVSPQIPIVSSAAQLSFMNYYNLGASPTNNPSPTTAYDGGVLDIQLDNYSFTNIVLAGGSFVSGGYNARITGHTDNPLAGKNCWSGNSGGFIPTVVNLPAAAAGHNIRLRWRCGTSSTNVNGGSGWYIDSVGINDGYYTCCVPLVAPSISAPWIDGTNFVFQFPGAPGQSYEIQSEDDATSSNWTTLQSMTGDGSVIYITNDLSAPQRFFRVISP